MGLVGVHPPVGTRQLGLHARGINYPAGVKDSRLAAGLNPHFLHSSFLESHIQHLCRSEQFNASSNCPAQDFLIEFGAVQQECRNGRKIASAKL